MRIDRVKMITEMARRDLTANRLAEKAGISRVTVSSIKRGATCADDTAIKIAKALDVPVSEIVETE